MKIGELDLDREVLVVAEVGNNHEGSFALAEELLGRAAETGVQAVKFQTFLPEHYVTCADSERLDRLRRFQLSRDEFARLEAQAREAGVIFFSTPFDMESARFLDGLQQVFKIASGDNTFFPLIEEVAGFGKPLMISTGLADIDLLERIHRLVHARWSGMARSPGLAFLHCVASYPVPLEQANLGAITTLRQRFPDCTIGYSDHTLGTRAAVCAVAAGARIIEKHFTLDKNQSSFRDHQLSADPPEMRELVAAVREVSALMGSGEKLPQACERENAVAVRRSIAAARELPAGAVLGAQDLTWVRPGSGIPAGEEWRVLDKRTRRSLRLGEIIRIEDLESS